MYNSVCLCLPISFVFNLAYLSYFNIFQHSAINNTTFTVTTLWFILGSYQISFDFSDAFLKLANFVKVFQHNDRSFSLQQYMGGIMAYIGLTCSPIALYSLQYYHPWCYAAGISIEMVHTIIYYCFVLLFYCFTVLFYLTAFWSGISKLFCICLPISTTGSEIDSPGGRH